MQCEDTLRRLIVELAKKEATVWMTDAALFGDGKRGYLEGITDARMVCASYLILLDAGQKQGKADPLPDIIKATEKHITLMRKVIKENDPSFNHLSYADKMSYIESSEDIIAMFRRWQETMPMA